MKLIYMYIDNFRNLQNEHFHFDRTFDITLKDNNTILIKKSDISSNITNINEYLFGDTIINNFTAIIGENGVGKSTVLDAIQYYCDSIDDKIGKSILIFLDKDKHFYVVSNTRVKEILLDGSLKSSYKLISDQNILGDMHQVQIIKLSNLLDVKHYYEVPDKNIINLTTGALMKQDLSNELDGQVSQNNINVLLNHHTFETKRQLNFFTNYRRHFPNIELPIKIPSQLEILVNDFHPKIERIFDEKNSIFEAEDKEILKDLFKKSFKNSSNISKKLVANILLDFLSSVTVDLNSKYNDKKRIYSSLITSEINKYFSNYLIDYLIDPININLIFYRLQEIINTLTRKILLSYSSNTFLNFIDALLKDDLLANLITHSQNIFENSLVVDFNNDNQNNILESVYLLFDAYNKCSFYLNCFKFNWRGLSTGEYNMLNTFAKLYSVTDNEENNKIKDKKQIILLIDEADATFHPEWQAQYMNLIIPFINVLFSRASVQIILTTHSPVLLSDFVSSNTIYLKKEGVLPYKEYTKTFAQNIYTLFTNAFFLKHPKGQFVEKIINKIDSDINHIEKNSKNEVINDDLFKTLNVLRDIVNEIGEPLIRNLYTSKLDSLKINDNSQLNDLMNLYKNLDSSAKNHFIDFIISQEEKND